MNLRNRAAASTFGVLIGCLVGAHSARADHQPVIALASNAQVPVAINGVDATGALVTGDWGLYAPGRVTPEVYAPVFAPAGLIYGPDPRGYFPKTGRRPRYGRQEVFGPRHVVPPAPSFYREWSSESGNSSVSEYPPYPAFDPPERVPPRRPAPRRRSW